MTIRKELRRLDYNKALRVTTGRGAPKSEEGFDGSMSIRSTRDGIKFFVKYGNLWYTVANLVEVITRLVPRTKKVGTHTNTTQSGSGGNSNVGVALKAGQKLIFDSHTSRSQRTRGNTFIKGHSLNTDYSGITTNALEFTVGSRNIMNIIENGSGSFVNLGNNHLVLDSIYAQDELSGTTLGDTKITLASDEITLICGGQNVLNLIEVANAGNKVTIDGGTLTVATTDDRIVDISATLNDTSDSGTHVFRLIKGNVTITDGTGWDTEYLIDLQVGESSVFNVNTIGSLTLANSTNTFASIRGAVGTNTIFQLNERGGSSIDDYMRMTVAAHGATTISTVDDNATVAHLHIDIDGEIKLDTTSSGDGAGVLMQNAGTTYANFSVHHSASYFNLYENGGASLNDYFSIAVAAAGVTTIGTTDGAGQGAGLILNADGDITLDSATGNFISMKDGTEFSARNSSYAGMILGCTNVFGSGTGGVYVQIGTAWENLLWDTDKFALVTFVVPPSNIVKISVHLPYVAAASYAFQLGLATDSSATTLNTKYENDVDDANRSDSFNINYSWVVEGSDHSWSPGETKTIYIMAYAANNIRFYTGGTNTSSWGGVIVEATALPVSIGDGSEP